MKKREPRKQGPRLRRRSSTNSLILPGSEKHYNQQKQRKTISQENQNCNLDSVFKDIVDHSPGNQTTNDHQANGSLDNDEQQQFPVDNQHQDNINNEKTKSNQNPAKQSRKRNEQDNQTKLKTNIKNIKKKSNQINNYKSKEIVNNENKKENDNYNQHPNLLSTSYNDPNSSKKTIPTNLVPKNLTDDVITMRNIYQPPNLPATKNQTTKKDFDQTKHSNHSENVTNFKNVQSIFNQQNDNDDVDNHLSNSISISSDNNMDEDKFRKTGQQQRRAFIGQQYDFQTKDFKTIWNQETSTMPNKMSKKSSESCDRNRTSSSNQSNDYGRQNVLGLWMNSGSILRPPPQLSDRQSTTSNYQQRKKDFNREIDYEFCKNSWLFKPNTLVKNKQTNKPKPAIDYNCIPANLVKTKINLFENKLNNQKRENEKLAVAKAKQKEENGSELTLEELANVKNIRRRSLADIKLVEENKEFELLIKYPKDDNPTTNLPKKITYIRFVKIPPITSSVSTSESVPNRKIKPDFAIECSIENNTPAIQVDQVDQNVTKERNADDYNWMDIFESNSGQTIIENKNNDVQCENLIPTFKSESSDITLIIDNEPSTKNNKLVIGTFDFSDDESITSSATTVTTTETYHSVSRTPSTKSLKSQTDVTEILAKTNEILDQHSSDDYSLTPPLINYSYIRKISTIFQNALQQLNINNIGSTADLFIQEDDLEEIKTEKDIDGPVRRVTIVVTVDSLSQKKRNQRKSKIIKRRFYTRNAPGFLNQLDSTIKHSKIDNLTKKKKRFKKKFVGQSTTVQEFSSESEPEVPIRLEDKDLNISKKPEVSSSIASSLDKVWSQQSSPAIISRFIGIEEPSIEEKSDLKIDKLILEESESKKDLRVARSKSLTAIEEDVFKTKMPMISDCDENVWEIKAQNKEYDETNWKYRSSLSVMGRSQWRRKNFYKRRESLDEYIQRKIFVQNHPNLDGKQPNIDSNNRLLFFKSNSPWYNYVKTSGRKVKDIENLSRNEISLYESMFEVMITEKFYLMNLDFLISLPKQFPSIQTELSEYSSKLLFGNVNRLYLINSSLFKQFNELFQEDCFMKKMFSVLQKYFNKDFEPYIDYIRTLNDRPKEIEGLACISESVIKNINSQLICPMQRITRYPLMLKEIVGKIQKILDSNDDDNVQKRHQMETLLNSSKKCYESAKLFANRCNETVDELKHLQELIEFKQSLDYVDKQALKNLVKNDRRLFQKAPIKILKYIRVPKVLECKLKYPMLVLLTDLIMLVDFKQKKNRYKLIHSAHLDRVEFRQAYNRSNSLDFNHTNDSPLSSASISSPTTANNVNKIDVNTIRFFEQSETTDLYNFVFIKNEHNEQFYRKFKELKAKFMNENQNNLNIMFKNDDGTNNKENQHDLAMDNNNRQEQKCSKFERKWESFF